MVKQQPYLNTVQSLVSLALALLANRCIHNEGLELYRVRSKLQEESPTAAYTLQGLLYLNPLSSALPNG